MFLHRWSERHEALNALCAVIQQGTHGLIDDLSLDLTDDDGIAVRGTSRSYYGVQLAILTTQQFGDRHRLFGTTQLLLRVNGSALELVVTHSSNDEAREAVSAHEANCRLQLTTVASA